MRWYILYGIIRMCCVIYEVVYFVWYHAYVLCDCFRWYILCGIMRMYCVIVSGGIAFTTSQLGTVIGVTSIPLLFLGVIIFSKFERHFGIIRVR